MGKPDGRQKGRKAWGQHRGRIRMADASLRPFGPGDLTPPFLKRRAVLYVDGFNLFHALLDQKRREWLWLDLQALGRGLIDPMERLTGVVWVSAHRPQARARMEAQFRYEAALRARGVRCLMGHFIVHGEHCRACGHGWSSATEKQSDVNLALAVADDVAANRVDSVYLLTTDGDHAATVRFVREAYPNKRIVSVAPPGRMHNRQIANWTDELVGVGPNLVARSMLPDRLKTAKGWIERPEAWSARPSLPPPPDPPPTDDAGKTKAGHLRLVVSNA
ncbi:hypothetical protein GCM10017620_15720 [Brevundimonas intermedia]|uniref:NYN domain-containing protein n=1 Tax=Brevundimonas intermedia TaxID=74315 RepID=A0ABQ5T973_9CAUL|nr:NYN domain-containing protein [Brevundimonas intermedia]GLK48599.1 hypothetical protein GCM10017620_15720 [Brevundimonas intermedia]